MAYTVIQAREPARALEQQLEARLHESKTPFTAVSATLDELRDFCASKLLENIEQAIDANMDDRLWKAHQNVNTRFRGSFSRLPKANVVERRKLSADYLRFLKAAQRFYRKYILDLYTTYGISELAKVAHKVDKSVVEPRQQRQVVTPKVRTLVLSSCHNTLIQLGDLSRYREAEIPSRDGLPDWSHAIGYYDLAGVLIPTSGVSIHQMAVIALQDKNQFATVYHLYRCMVTREPHPQALGNLKRAFHKLSNSKEAGNLFDSGARGHKRHVLRTWYLLVVLDAFHGKDIQGRELEREFLHHLQSFVSTGAPDGTLRKIVLTNLAATMIARQSFLDGAGEEAANSFLAFLRLSIETLKTILDACHTELSSTLASNVHTDKLSAKISPLLQGLLPVLRIYSSWLFEYAAIIAGANGMGIESLQSAFWTSLARCLTLTTLLFPVDQLPDLKDMLPEDMCTIGFLPVHNEQSRHVWYASDGTQCAMPEEAEDPEEVARQMLFRIRYFLILGVTLATQNEDAPLTLKDGKFLYKFADAEFETPNNAIRLPPGLNHPSQLSLSQPHVTREITKNDQDAQAERMVDDLVSGSFEDSPPHILDSAPLPSTLSHPSLSELTTAAPRVSRIPATAVSPLPRSEGTYNIQDIVKTFRQSPAPRASPGISPRWVASTGINSPPFTPLSAAPRASQSSFMAREGSVDGGRGGAGASAAAAAPMARTFSSRSHARAHSGESIPRRSIWTPEPGVDGPTSPGLQSPTGMVLGNGTFGATETAVPSSMLFGAGNSPWSLSAEESHRMPPSSPTAAGSQSWSRTSVSARPLG